VIIRCVDLETTGEADGDAPIEVGWCDFDGLAISPPEAMLLDPGVPIAPEASAVHHLLAEDLTGAPQWRPALAAVMAADDVDAFCAHQIEFERRWCETDKSWVCTYRCALRAWPDFPKHSLQAIRYRLDPVGLDRGRAAPAHRAGPDAYAAAFVLRELLLLHPLETLLAWSAEDPLPPRVTFGRHRGELWSAQDRGFLLWVLRKDFDAGVKRAAREALERKKEET